MYKKINPIYLCKRREGPTFMTKSYVVFNLCSAKRTEHIHSTFPDRVFLQIPFQSMSGRELIKIILLSDAVYI